MSIEKDHVKACVLVSGPSMSDDKDLIFSLKRVAPVLTNGNNSKMEFVLKDNDVDVIILELSNKESKELEILKRVKRRFPRVKIILINGDRELFVKAFSLGVKDAFKKPYRKAMLVERVYALLTEN